MKTFLFRSNWLIIFIILLGFIVRLYKIDNPVADWHSWRQADTASVSKVFLDNGINLLYPRFQDLSSVQAGLNNPEGWRFVEFPLFNAVHVFLATTFREINFDVWGRLISVISSTFSILLMYFIGSFLSGRRTGLLSAFFFAFIPFNVYFSRVILPEPLAVTFGLLSIYLFLRWIRLLKLLLLIGSGVFMALALLLKPYIFFYLIPLFFVAYKKFGIRGMVGSISLWLFLDIAFVPLFLWRVWMWNFPSGIPAWEWAFNGDRIRFKPAFWWWIFGERLGRLILGGWGLIYFVLGIATRIKKEPFYFIFFLGSFFYLSLVATANVRHDYYQTLIIPPIAFLMAKGVDFILESKEIKEIAEKGIILVPLVFMFLFGMYQVKEFYKVNHPEIVEAGRVVDKIIPKDALVIAPYNGDTAFLYQTRRLGWPVNDSSIENLIDKGADYYVSVNFSDPDTVEIMKKYRIIARTENYVIADLHTLQ